MQMGGEFDREICKTENRFSRKEMECTIDNHNCMCNICAKGFLDSESNR